MKILVVSSRGYASGGAESLILLSKAALVRDGHEVKIFTSDERAEAAQFSDYQFRNLARSSKPVQALHKLFYPQALLSLKRVLREYRPDVVHVHTAELLSPSIFFALKGIPTLVTIHGPEEYLSELMLSALPPRMFKRAGTTRQDLNASGRLHYLYHKLLSRPLYRLGFKNVDAFITHSAYMQEAAAKEGVSSHHVTIGTALFDASPISTRSQVIAYAGRLERAKGTHTLISAMPALLQKHPNLKLAVAGTGTYEQPLRDLAGELGLEQSVEFMGKISRHQVYELYKACVIAVMPSIWPEPFGLSGVEAMSVGRPVVASNVGGISEWLADDVVGKLIEPNNPAVLAEALHELLDNPAELKRMAATAGQAAQQYDIKKYATSIAQLYSFVIRRHRTQ